MDFVQKIDGEMQGGDYNNSNECKKYIPAGDFVEKILCIKLETGFLIYWIRIEKKR